MLKYIHIIFIYKIYYVWKYWIQWSEFSWKWHFLFFQVLTSLCLNIHKYFLVVLIQLFLLDTNCSFSECSLNFQILWVYVFFHISLCLMSFEWWRPGGTRRKAGWKGTTLLHRSPAALLLFKTWGDSIQCCDLCEAVISLAGAWDELFSLFWHLKVDNFDICLIAIAPKAHHDCPCLRVCSCDSSSVHELWWLNHR